MICAMRCALALLAAGVAAVLLAAPAPLMLGAARLEAGRKVEALLVEGGRLYAALDDGTLLVLKLPNLEVLSRARLPGRPVALGMLGGGLAAVLEDGRLLLSGGRLVELLEPGEELEATAVSAGRVVLVVRYRYGANVLHRLAVCDAEGRRLLVRDAESGDLLVYVFGMEAVGSLLMLVDIDTTCVVCRLTDTMVEVYNLTSLELLYSRRMGSCVADLNSTALIAVSVRTGEGVLVDLASMREERFRVEGKPVAAHASGYVLARTKEGLALYRVGRGARPVGMFPEGYALGVLGDEVLVLGVEAAYTGSTVLEVENVIPPQKPTLTLEYEGGLIALYGRRLIYSVYTASVIVVLTEPRARLEVHPLGVSATADDAGRAALRLPPGRYRVTACREGFENATVEVEAKAGELVEVEIPLKPLTPNVAATNATAEAMNVSKAYVQHVEERQLSADAMEEPRETSSTAEKDLRGEAEKAAEGSASLSDAEDALSPHNTLTGLAVRDALRTLEKLASPDSIAGLAVLLAVVLLYASRE